MLLQALTSEEQSVSKTAHDGLVAAGSQANSDRDKIAESLADFIDNAGSSAGFKAVQVAYVFFAELTQCYPSMSERLSPAMRGLKYAIDGNTNVYSGSLRRPNLRTAVPLVGSDSSLSGVLCTTPLCPRACGDCNGKGGESGLPVPRVSRARRSPRAGRFDCSRSVVPPAARARSRSGN